MHAPGQLTVLACQMQLVRRPLVVVKVRKAFVAMAFSLAKTTNLTVAPIAKENARRLYNVSPLLMLRNLQHGRTLKYLVDWLHIRVAIKLYNSGTVVSLGFVPMLPCPVL
eukprot:TRINITY_DN38300_c0_g1_i1.p2 TRINITY_DN38300_c0_g1~~TRINITY_DN38300_c0_g1_i1.p2  ORF type:complete len:110 (+),score=5.24 TRINITY_DN38300_c0_g1_i1:222-551(+)